MHKIGERKEKEEEKKKRTQFYINPYLRLEKSISICARMHRSEQSEHWSFRR